MPVYNGERYLSDAIESVLAQTHEHFELLIVNDASTDRSGDIAKDWARRDHRIRVLENPHNLRQSRTRNRAITEADGEYIALVDADDVCIANRFEQQLAYLELHQEIDVVGSAYCLFATTKPNECLEVVRAAATDIYRGLPPVHNPTCLIRRSVFSQLGSYDHRYDNAEDVELWFRWFSSGVRFDNLPEILYKKRAHRNSVSVAHIRSQVFLLLQINLRAVLRYRIPFTTRGYARIGEQLLYLCYLWLGLDRWYRRGANANALSDQ